MAFWGTLPVKGRGYNSLIRYSGVRRVTLVLLPLRKGNALSSQGQTHSQYMSSSSHSNCPITPVTGHPTGVPTHYQLCPKIHCTAKKIQQGVVSTEFTGLTKSPMIMFPVMGCWDGLWKALYNTSFVSWTFPQQVHTLSASSQRAHNVISPSECVGLGTK